MDRKIREEWGAQPQKVHDDVQESEAKMEEVFCEQHQNRGLAKEWAASIGKKKETGSALKWAEKNGTVCMFRAIFLRQQHVQEKVWLDFHEVGVRLILEISRNHTRELGGRGLLGRLCRGVPKKRENTR